MEAFDRSVYETYEWDDFWMEKAKRPEGKRVLYIGDSIARGTRRLATARSEERLLFDGYSTSKGIDNPWLKEQLRLIAQQCWPPAAVLFNSGLHGWHLDPGDYGARFEDMLLFLKELFPGTPLFPVLTTAVASEKGKAVVEARNRAVLMLAEKHGLPVIDLHAVSQSRGDFISGDGIHPTPEGYGLLAEAILSALREKGIW